MSSGHIRRAVRCIEYLKSHVLSIKVLEEIARMHIYLFSSWVSFSIKMYLPVGESNPGLPRDRRGYSPLY